MTPRKTDFPLDQCRCHLETGPIVLVGSQWQTERNLMVMGWHMMLGFTPAHFGCLITAANHSHRLVRESRECTINIPTLKMVDAVVGVGNSDGDALDKLDAFGLTPTSGEIVSAPLVEECYASFECRLVDDSQIDRHELFIWEIVKAHVDTSIDRPRTLHYRGHGHFMVAGDEIEQAYEMAVEVAHIQLAELANTGQPTPKPRHIAEHRDNPEFAGWGWGLVEIDVTLYLGKAEKVNVTQPERLISQIDDYVSMHGIKSRSAFLAGAAQHELERRAQ